MNADFATLVGRVLLAAIFVVSGFLKIGGFAGVAGAIASKGLPLPEAGAVLTIVLELVGGLMIVVGWKTRWAALALAVFLVPVTFLFHPFWSAPAEFNAFWKNIAILGGMLVLWAHGPGRLSVDRA